MINTALQRLDRSVRLMGPFVVSIILVMLSALPIYVPGYGQIAVEVGLVTVFYWAVTGPIYFPFSQHLPWVYGKTFWWSSPIGLHALTCCLQKLGDCIPADLFSWQGVQRDLVELLAGCLCCCGTVVDSRLCVST